MTALNPTVAEYVIERLAALGIDHVFGVPGDYTFPIDDAVEKSPNVHWIGSANELNAAYAADGYARVRGAAILSTTYGVGELSALNGVMGSKSERLAVFHLVGQPSTRLQRSRAITHHTLGDGVFGQFEQLSAAAACVSAHLTPQNAIAEVERVIGEVLTHRQPGYITLAQDMALLPVIGTPITGVPLTQFALPLSNPAVLAAAVDAIVTEISSAETTVVLPAFTIGRYGLQEKLTKFLDHTGLAYATTRMDKGVISESTPNFLGMYGGSASGPGVQTAVESADLVLDLGGVAFVDINTGIWTADIDPAKHIVVGPHHVQLGTRSFGPTSLGEVLDALTAALPGGTVRRPTTHPPVEVGALSADTALTSEHFYPRLAHFLSPDDIVVVETGLCAGKVPMLPFPPGAVYHSQVQWGSIGWATPAAFGAALASPDRRTILVTGDGSHQLTANEIGAIARYRAKPIIFVLNNSMFGIEEVLSPIQGHEYDVLAAWKYHALPAALGADNWFTAKVATVGELDDALTIAAAHDDASYIELVLGPGDVPASLPPELLERMYRINS